jgi:peptide/nickel transport system substrate-binding protein
MVESWQNGDQISLVTNADYWGDPPATPKLVLRKIPDNSARFLALRSGDIDGMNQMNPEDIAPAQSDEKLQVVFEPANNVGYLGFNQAKAPWGNQDCRLAVAHAIDKQAIVDGLHAGDAETANQMMPPKQWGYNTAITDHGFDMAAAHAALDACLAEETMPETVALFVPPIARFYFPKPAELGESIQASLAELGITTQIQSPEWQTYLTQVRAGEAELFLLGWGGDNGDPDNYLCVFFCGGDGAWNSDADGTAMPPSDALNELLREAATISDQAARQSMYEEANQMVHDEVLAVPLVHRTPPLGFSAAVSGYVSSPIQTILSPVSKQ